ncbi:MAG: N-acetylmuramoyl-L-alanine amidase [Lachnospiraceae bacterium]|nr:N-acetylmuramoyl-L-alanine amidase [Lachnospiraceae bacterium]
MGKRTYKSDEFERYSERERRKQEWIRKKNKERLRNLTIIFGGGFVLIAVVALIIGLIVSALIPDDTAEIEDNLSKTTSDQISLVDNTSDNTLDFGSDEKTVKSPVFVSNRGVIVIDPGHGGYDSGILSSKKYEKQVDLEIAMLLSEDLKDKGFDVFLTRTDDNFLGVNDRVDLANEQEEALALISIHQNFSDKDSDEGVEVHTVQNEKNEQLAQLIVDEVAENTGAINGGVKLSDNLVICSKVDMPAVVVECGYLTNKREAQNLWEESYQKKIASAIASAVDTFVPVK